MCYTLQEAIVYYLLLRSKTDEGGKVQTLVWYQEYIFDVLYPGSLVDLSSFISSMAEVLQMLEDVQLKRYQIHCIFAIVFQVLLFTFVVM